MIEPDGGFSDLQSHWDALRQGDPGPIVAFVDALLSHDMAFAAGGLLRDIVERIRDASETLDAEEQKRFLAASLQALMIVYDGDRDEVEQLLREADCTLTPDDPD